MGNLRQSMTDEEWEKANKNWNDKLSRVSTNFHQVINTIERPTDNITWEVMRDLASRAELGLKKYNTTLHQNNHQNMLQHAYEEALDFAQYLKKEITILNTIQDLVKQYGNDADLGEIVRKIYGKK